METKNTATGNFVVLITTKESTLAFKFTMSKTGVLDYSGELDFSEIKENVDGYQEVEASSYFSTSWYTYLPKELQAHISVCATALDLGALNADQYSFLMHIGALLLAVKERDSLLVAELLDRRTSVFAHFLPMVQYIVKPVAAEALFVWLYGRFSNDYILQNFYKSGAKTISDVENAEVILFLAAQESLKPKPESETLEEMFIRYFKEKKELDFTTGIVGSGCHYWVNGFKKLDNAISHHMAHDFTEGLKALREARQKFFEELSVSVQAEPYNPHDNNAIGVSIEDMDAKISGMGGKSKAGYLRATGAAVLRKARPDIFAYNAKLWRVGNSQDSKQGVVLRIVA
ncbi:MAG: hypothetical protein HUK21_03165 [Fibrobacteraceae bacterium]|nr:hypothetical protein [Fibrobacteraceae bacterium]